MTVVAMFQIDVPLQGDDAKEGRKVLASTFIISDVLTSTKARYVRDDYVLDVATTEDATAAVHALKDEDFVPVGVCQKTFILSKDIAIGWSGSLRSAQLMLRELIAANNRSPLNLASLKEAIETADKEHGLCYHAESDDDRVDLVGFVDGAGGGPFFYGPTVQHYPRQRNIRALAVIGTGGDEVGKQLCKYDNEEDFSNPNEFTTDQLTIYTVLTHASWLACDEVATWKSLANLYGGAYELIALTDEGFGRYDSATYVFFYVRLLPDGKFAMHLRPSRAFRIAYHGEAMLIRKAKFTDSDTCQTTMTHVPPAYREELTEAEMSAPLPSMNTTCHVAYYIVEKGGLYKGAVSATSYCQILWMRGRFD